VKDHLRQLHRAEGSSYEERESGVRKGGESGMRKAGEIWGEQV
jgi:hypothetical protein